MWFHILNGIKQYIKWFFLGSKWHLNEIFCVKQCLHKIFFFAKMILIELFCSGNLVHFQPEQRNSNQSSMRFEQWRNQFSLLCSIAARMNGVHGRDFQSLSCLGRWERKKERQRYACIDNKWIEWLSHLGSLSTRPSRAFRSIRIV